MGAIDKDRHRPWLAYALEESLERSLLAPRDVIDHANPEVLVTQLPPAVISELLSRALSMGTFSPAQVLESAPPALLAEHLNPQVMWRCLKEAADRGGLSRKGGTRSNPARQWFASVLARALESELITPADIVRFLPPSEFVVEAPRPVLAELIKDALARSSFDAALVLQHVTPIVIAENLETSLVWDCIAEAVARHFDLDAAPVAPAGRAAETVPVKTAAPAAAPILAPSSAVAKQAIARSLEKTAERKVAPPGDKAAPVAIPSSPRSFTSGPTVARAESAPARHTAPAVVPAAAAAAALATAPAVAAPAVTAPAPGAGASEWSPADDLDVLEDQPLPFPLPR
ncbi:MAG TPA: hypothetical protein VFH68_17245 [Polyangia bacterium]|jgi:hypothetical protein|nr:hypothetical protein [Polyangia bacterium]